MPARFLSAWPLIFAGLIGALSQGQLTFGRVAHETLGLTINFADMLIPPLGLIILYRLFLDRGGWPNWQGRWTDGFVALLSVLFVFSLWWGGLQSGTVTDWALINRLLGWVVILAYFYAGAYLVTRAGPSAFYTFLKYAAYAVLVTTVFNAAAIILLDLGVLYPPSYWRIIAYPLDGFSGNRNLFSFFFSASLIVATILGRDGRAGFPAWMLPAYYLAFPMLVYLNGSRALLMFAPVLLLILFALYRRMAMRVFVPFLLAGTVMMLGTLQITGKTFFRESQIERMNTILELGIDTEGKYRHPSDSIRAIVYQEAIYLWQAHPVLGIGLGQYLEIQKQRHGALIDLIDSVPLWLLCEMGLVGFVAFMAFALSLLLPYLQVRRVTDPEVANIRAVVLMVALLFLVMGTFHQLFYMRFLWFFLGMAAVSPLLHKPAQTG